MTTVRLSAWAAPGALIALSGLLAFLGLIESGEAMMLGAAIVAAFGPSGWIVPSGWRRRAAEAILLIAAAALIFIPSASMRRVAVDPICVAAAWAAWSACVHRARGAGSRAVAAGAFGLAAACATLWPPVDGAVPGIGVLAMSALLPAATAAISTAAVPVVVCLAMIVALTAGPSIVWIVTVACAVILAVWGRRYTSRPDASTDGGPEWLRGWYPAVGAILFVVAAIGPWGGLAPGELLPSLSWIGYVFIIGLLLVALRLPPPTAGACTVLVCLLLGPALPPTPEGGGVDLDGSNPSIRLRQGDGGDYSIDVAGRGFEGFKDGTMVAMVMVGDTRLPLRVGHLPSGRPTLELFGSAGVVDRWGSAVWRTAGGREPGWRETTRYRFEVPAGVVPEFRLADNVEDRVDLRVEATGPTLPTAPRGLPGEQWLWLAAAAIALLQLLSGANRAPSGWLPWLLVTFGLVVARCSVEPLHLTFERHGVDLALAAFLAAWVPTAAVWFRRGRVFRAAAALLVPLAIATVHLTPPLWGDEPFHLALMESIVTDHDLDVANNLVGGGGVGEIIASSDHLFHSPALAAILLPGYAAAGRTGALTILALFGAAAVTWTNRRFVVLSAPNRRAVVLLGLTACLTYPLATFSTQIWPGVVGAALVAAGLVLAGGSRRGRIGAAATALVATAVKTRMALVTFPVAAIGWWREDRRVRRVGIALTGIAAVAALVFGWATMGHPFGFYRRLHHLVPTDPGLALRVVGGLLFGGAGGLAWTAPLWLVVLPALVLVWRRGESGERAALVGVAATVAALLSSGEWYGGGSPPARYLVPALPLVLLAVGFGVSRPDPRRRLLALFWPAAFIPWWVLVTRPHYSINPGDGRWWLTNSLSRRFAADSRALFPSYLTPTTASVVAPIVLIAGGFLLWRVMRRPRLARALARLGPALWLVATIGLVATLGLRTDTVVEAESAQVRRSGGQPMPPAGTPARYTHADGWKMGDGDTLTFPLNLDASKTVSIEAAIVRPGWGGTLLARWDGGAEHPVKVRRANATEPIVIPAPRDGGRHRLQLGWTGHKGAELFVDRVVVEGE